MLTFLELYQTLLGFVFFKLYTDAGLVYPPPLDVKKDEGAAGVGAFSLQETNRVAEAGTSRKAKEVEVDGAKKRVPGSIAFVPTTESWLNPMREVIDGVLGSQDVNICH